ncbi:hypothetical protein HanIR_Chr12g0607551 [Helianthus annuus]|nr:hypothetical protein HanIR_Chr12g0607551 [Helianthus annuus]
MSHNVILSRPVSLCPFLQHTTFLTGADVHGALRLFLCPPIPYSLTLVEEALKRVL